MIKKQTDALRNKLLLQASRVWSKVKPLRSKQDKKEVSNQEVQLMLYQYSSSENVNNEYSEWMFERIHEALSKLDVEQMEVIKRRYWNAESYGIIGAAMGHTGHAGHMWASRKEAEATEVIRGALNAQKS